MLRQAIFHSSISRKHIGPRRGQNKIAYTHKTTIEVPSSLCAQALGDNKPHDQTHILVVDAGDEHTGCFFKQVAIVDSGRTILKLKESPSVSHAKLLCALRSDSPILLEELLV